MYLLLLDKLRPRVQGTSRDCPSDLGGERRSLLCELNDRAVQSSVVTDTQTNGAAALLRSSTKPPGGSTSCTRSMNDPAVQSNSQRLVAASKEAGQLEPVVSRYRAYLKAQTEADHLEAAVRDSLGAGVCRTGGAELPERGSAPARCLKR
jgi:hypothetical protein